MDDRAHILDGDGRIIGVHELDCADDEDARQKAAQFLDGTTRSLAARAARRAIEHHTRQ